MLCSGENCSGKGGKVGGGGGGGGVGGEKYDDIYPKYREPMQFLESISLSTH